MGFSEWMVPVRVSLHQPQHHMRWRKKWCGAASGSLHTCAMCSIVGSMWLCVQVIKDLSINAHSRSALVSYTLPPNTTGLSASLTARILLALPGANGEPDYQDFDIQALLPGQTGLQHR